MTAPLVYPLGTEDAFGIVNNAYGKWSQIALQAFAQAQQLVGTLTDVPITPVTFDATFDPQLALPGFVAPTAPQVPTAALQFNSPPLPVQPPSLDAPAISTTAAPTFDVAAPVYMPPAVPQLATLTAPGAAPTLVDPTLPVAPDYVLPEIPALDALPVPDMPTLDIPTFDELAPVFSAVAPDENFSFAPEPYVDSLLDKTKSTLSAMMDGDFVLPQAVATALRNRAFEAANREEARAVDQTYAEFGSRGFDEPPGLLIDRIAIAHDKAQLTRAGTNRDVYVQDQQVAIENLRAAVSGGIQLEGQLIQLHVSETEMQFNAAKFALDVAVQIFQTRLAEYNAEVQAYGVKAAVFRDRIQAALAQAEVYRIEIEALRIRGELNMQKVQLYTAQLQGINTMVEVYRAQVAATESISRINVSKVEAYSAEVGAFRAQIEAQTSQWQGYKAQTDAQLGVVQFYDTSARAFGSRVQAWSMGEETKVHAAQLKIEQNKMALDAWRGKVQLFEEQLKAEMARVGAVKDALQAQVEVYKGQVGTAVAAGEYDNRRFQLNLAQEQAIVETSLKRSEASFEQLRYITTVMIEIKKTLALVQSQLAASAMNAVHIGATASSSGSQSVSWSTGVSISESGEDF